MVSGCREAPTTAIDFGLRMASSTRGDLTQNPQQPRVRAPADEALGVRDGDDDAGEAGGARGVAREVLLDGAAGEDGVGVAHRGHYLVPRAAVRRAVRRGYAVDVAAATAPAHLLQ